jgi:hypothetical protein
MEQTGVLAAPLWWAAPGGAIGSALEPQSEVKYFLLCTRKPTLACNTSEFARHLLTMLAVPWRDDPCRFSHVDLPKNLPLRHITVVSVIRFREGRCCPAGKSPSSSGQSETVYLDAAPQLGRGQDGRNDQAGSILRDSS